MEIDLEAINTNLNVYLRELNLSDADLFKEWIGDYEVVKYSLGLFLKLKPKEVRGWLEKVINDDGALSLGIVRKDRGELIGYAGLADISSTNKSAEYFIFIGDKGSWNKGFGTEVTRMIISYGFKVLGLNRIQLTVSEPNIGGVTAYKRAGFREEGVMRQAVLRDGLYHNKIMMAVIRSDWARAGLR